MAAEKAPSGARLAGRYTLLGIVTFVVLFPVYTTVIAALKPGSEVLKKPLIPNAFTLDVLSDAWTNGRLGRYLLNSLIVAVIITIGQLVTSVMSAYAFAMLDFPGREALFVLFLATLLVPLEATLVVNRRTVDSFGWLNSSLICFGVSSRAVVRACRVRLCAGLGLRPEALRFRGCS